MASLGDLTWYREAELIHGRIAQLAVVGFLAPGLFGTLPGNEWTGVDAYSKTNPLEAFSAVPGLAILQIFLKKQLFTIFSLALVSALPGSQSNQTEQTSNQVEQESNQVPQESNQVAQMSNQVPQTSNQTEQTSDQVEQETNQVPE